MSAFPAELTLKDYRLAPAQVPPTVVESLEPAEKAELIARIAAPACAHRPGARSR